MPFFHKGISLKKKIELILDYELFPTALWVPVGIPFPQKHVQQGWEVQSIKWDMSVVSEYGLY